MENSALLEEILRIVDTPQLYSSDVSVNTSTLGLLLVRVRHLSENNLPELKQLEDMKYFRFIRPYLVDREKEVRILALRVLRHLCFSAKTFELLKSSGIEHFVVRSFELEGRAQERIEACKLIRHWLTRFPKNFPKSFINALVAISEVESDEMKELGLEAIRVLSISATELVALSGGFKVLIKNVLDLKCSRHMSENIILTLLYLLNEEKTRKYLKGEKEMFRILAPFTEHDSGLRDSELEPMIELARRALVMMSRSWVGLIFLASSGLREVIDNLRQPIKPLIKEGILVTITDMLSVPIETSAKQNNLLNNYLAMLLRALLHCNLFPSLTQLAIDRDDRIAQKARKLLKLITKSASDLLPEAPQFPIILDSTSAGKAAELVADIDSSTRLQKEVGSKNLLNAACEFVSFDNMGGVSSVNWVLSGIYKQHAMNMVDDSMFTALLNKSNVRQDPSRWDWDTIYEILAGPISTPQRLQIAHKTKFLKNLLGFFMPSKRLFPDLHWHPSNFVKARVGSILISLLLSQDEGVQLLTQTFSESFFVSRRSYMGELADAIDEEISVLESGRPSVGRLFTPEMMRGHMAREYFKWIGQFTMFRNGRKLMKNFGIDTKVMKLAPIEHLSPILMSNLDYKEESSRIFLSYAMQSKSLFVRKHAMEHLRVLFRAGIYNLGWAVTELVNKLYSPDKETISCALSVIDELCQEKENLLTFIKTGPQTLTRLGEEGNKSLIRFLSSSSGVNYLSHFDFIEKEMEKWKQSGNLEYVKMVEQRIEAGLSGAKKPYALTLPTPIAYMHSERLEAAWIRKLPFSITLHVYGRNSVTVYVDTTIEIEGDDVYMVGKFEPETSEESLITKKDTIAVCLVLGNYYIDSRGQESGEPDWINCTKEDREVDSQDEVTIEKDGVLFELKRESHKTFSLLGVRYRLLVLPRAAPTMLFPRHLYGELVKTKLGLNKLKESGDVEYLLESLKKHSPIIEKRAALWGLGHIGCTERGVKYLISLNAVDNMIEIAEKSPVLSLRGTAFQAVSLLARTNLGKAELSKRGWACSEPIHATIAMPENPSSIFWLENHSYNDLFSEDIRRIEAIIDSVELTEEQTEVLKNIVALGGVVNRTEAEQFLRNKRMESPQIFQSVELFHAVMSLLAAYNFKVPSRRLIHKLFERIYRSQNNLQELENFKYI